MLLVTLGASFLGNRNRNVKNWFYGNNEGKRILRAGYGN